MVGTLTWGTEEQERLLKSWGALNKSDVDLEMDGHVAERLGMPCGLCVSSLLLRLTGDVSLCYRRGSPLAWQERARPRTRSLGSRAAQLRPRMDVCLAGALALHAELSDADRSLPTHDFMHLEATCLHVLPLDPSSPWLRPSPQD